MKHQVLKLRFVALTFVLAIFSLSASAYDFKSDSLYYNINPDGKTATVTYGTEKYAMPIVEIPAKVTHDGKTYTVIAIGDKAFYQSKVDSEVMANTIEEVQAYAFEQCSVSRIQFSKGLKHIRKYAFNGTRLRHVILYEGLETMEDYAFAEYTTMGDGKIISIQIPTSVTSIGRDCFMQQRVLQKLVLPENLKVVPANMCSGCTNLREVVLPKNVVEIQYRAFENCSLKEINFPSKLKIIGEYAFGNTQLESVVMPDNIEELGESTFISNRNLGSITFSKGLKELPKYVCQSCDKLIEVNIPEGVTKIGNSAFADCI